MEAKEFPTAAVVSLTTGIALCKFDEIHGAAEWLMGHSIWTHHFASKPLWSAMKAAALVQHPSLPTTLTGVTKDNYEEHVARLITQFGPTLSIAKGAGETAMSPTDGIPDHPKERTVIVTV